MVKQAAREHYGWLDGMKLIAIRLMYAAHYDGMGRYRLMELRTALGVLFFCVGIYGVYSGRSGFPAVF